MHGVNAALYSAHFIGYEIVTRLTNWLGSEFERKDFSFFENLARGVLSNDGKER